MYSLIYSQYIYIYDSNFQQENMKIFTLKEGTQTQIAQTETKKNSRMSNVHRKSSSPSLSTKTTTTLA